jgi:hypothetical protein
MKMSICPVYAVWSDAPQGGVRKPSSPLRCITSEKANTEPGRRNRPLPLDSRKRAGRGSTCVRRRKGQPRRKTERAPSEPWKPGRGEPRRVSRRPNGRARLIVLWSAKGNRRRLIPRCPAKRIRPLAGARPVNVTRPLRRQFEPKDMAAACGPLAKRPGRAPHMRRHEAACSTRVACGINQIKKAAALKERAADKAKSGRHAERACYLESVVEHSERHKIYWRLGRRLGS